MPVSLTNGRRLGRLEDVGHALDFIHVRQGRLLIRDWYIPVAAIRGITVGGVQLAVGMAELRARRWHVPPESYLARQGATPGYEYTDLPDVASNRGAVLGPETNAP
ncbi:MAG TPA: hypothetical protein VKX16_09885 [Chloroflexota bacterium]|nr:hypothetical protein [Chloroflexota bacterium]